MTTKTPVTLAGGSARKSYEQADGCTWIEDECNDEPMECEECGSECWQGMTLLDGGDWLCRECWDSQHEVVAAHKVTPEPTPTPWRVENGTEVYAQDYPAPIANTIGETYRSGVRASLLRHRDEANAALIVAAVNERAALLAERDAFRTQAIRNDDRARTAEADVSSVGKERDRLKAERAELIKALGDLLFFCEEMNPRETMPELWQTARALLARIGKGE